MLIICSVCKCVSKTLIPLRNKGHFLHVDTSLTDMVSPTCVIVIRPAL